MLRGFRVGGFDQARLAHKAKSLCVENVGKTDQIWPVRMMSDFE